MLPGTYDALDVTARKELLIQREEIKGLEDSLAEANTKIETLTTAMGSILEFIGSRTQ